MKDLSVKVKVDNEEIDVVIHDLEVSDDGYHVNIDYTADDKYNKSMVESAVGNFVLTALERGVKDIEV